MKNSQLKLNNLKICCGCLLAFTFNPIVSCEILTACDKQELHSWLFPRKSLVIDHNEQQFCNPFNLWIVSFLCLLCHDILDTMKWRNSVDESAKTWAERFHMHFQEKDINFYCSVQSQHEDELQPITRDFMGLKKSANWESEKEEKKFCCMETTKTDQDGNRRRTRDVELLRTTSFHYLGSRKEWIFNSLSESQVALWI